MFADAVAKEKRREQRGIFRKREKEQKGASRKEKSYVEAQKRITNMNDPREASGEGKLHVHGPSFFVSVHGKPLVEYCSRLVVQMVCLWCSAADVFLCVCDGAIVQLLK